MPRTQPNRAPTPLQLSSGNAADFKANSAGCESNSAESPSNSATRESNSAELQVTIPQSSKANSAEDDASSAAFVSNSAVSQLIDARAVSLLSSSTTKATSMESITESEREGEGGPPLPGTFGSLRASSTELCLRTKPSFSERASHPGRPSSNWVRQSAPAAKERASPQGKPVLHLEVKRPEKTLIDKVPNIREHRLTQFHTQQACVGGAQLRFKTFQHVTRQIRLLPQQAQQRRAVHRAFVVAGKPAGRADSKGQWDRSCPGGGGTGRPSAQVDSHA